jgi:hypothetical protein
MTDLPPRREWPRIPVPPALFDLLITLARTRGYNERTLYLYLYETVKAASPEEFAKFASYFDLSSLEPPPPSE